MGGELTIGEGAFCRVGDFSNGRRVHIVGEEILSKGIGCMWHWRRVW